MTALLIQEAASQGIGAASVLAVVGSLLGAVLGALTGLLGERWVRGRGEIRCRLVELSQLGAYITEPVVIPPEQSFGPASPQVLDKLVDDPEVGIYYEVKWRMFNEKEEAAGLADVSVAFIDGQGQEAAVISPHTPQTEHYDVRSSAEEGVALKGAFTLRPQIWMEMWVVGTLRGREALLSHRAQAVALRATLTNGKSYRQRVDIPVEEAAAMDQIPAQVDTAHPLWRRVLGG